MTLSCPAGDCHAAHFSDLNAVLQPAMVGRLQERLQSEQQLGDADSVFREVHGLTIHYKLAQCISSERPLAIHAYHGFGANTGSWAFVHHRLAEQLHAQVTKHDMPGFGLSQR